MFKIPADSPAPSATPLPPPICRLFKIGAILILASGSVNGSNIGAVGMSSSIYCMTVALYLVYNPAGVPKRF